MPQRVGIVGLGIMGSAYAAHLIDAGCEPAGYDVDELALRRFAERGGAPRRSPADVARDSDVVITALPSTAAVESAFFGEGGIAQGAREGLVVVEASTLPLALKERCRDALVARGAQVLDAPVSGTGSQARDKDLCFYVSGDRAASEVAAGTLLHVARVVRYVGAFGTGSKLKYIANLLVTIHNLSTAEAVVLALKAGIDPTAMIEVIGEGAGASRMLAVRGPMMVAGGYDDPGMKLEVYQKDLDIIADFARAVGAPTPLFSQSAVFYTAALAQGRGKQDTAAIASVLKSMAGLPADG